MFHVYLRGEDRTEFTIQCDVDTMDEARKTAEERYPEAIVLEVFDPVQRADAAYHRAQAIYDDPDLDYYDY